MKSAPAMLFAILIATTAYSQTPQLAFKSVEVDGGEMAYAELGNPSGDPVLLIQGSFVADAFLPLARTFELQEYRLILVNLRGYGRSSKVEAPFGEADYAKDMEALIAALDVTSVHVRTLTLIEPGGFCNLRPELCPPRPQRDNSRSADSYTAEDNRAAVDDRVSRLFGGMQALEQIPGAYEQMLADIGDTYFGVQHSPMTPRWDFDPARHLADMDQPILFIYFDVGNAGHPTYSEMFRQHHAATEVVSLEGSHHSFHLEQPHETAEAIAAFLERNAAESSRSQGVN
jgi:pimeloyl-ACP methyl ester carboxylesterase